MQFLNYFLASLASFFGLAIGISLVRIAPEEQKPLGKYFVKLRKLLIMLIFVFLGFYYFKSPFYLSVLVACFVFMLFIGYKAKGVFIRIMMSYQIFGILFFLSSRNKNLFVLESSLMLLYGLPAASLICNKKNHYKVISYNSGFIIVANLLYLVTTSRFLF